MLSNGFWSRLRRYPRAGYVAGVCAGLAAYFDWNVRLIRVLFLLTLFFSGFFPILLVYAVLWYLMQSDPGQPSGPGGPQPGEPPSSSPGDLHSRFARMEQRLRTMESCVASRDYELRRELRKLEG